VDAVCTAAYRADDGEEAAILVNATWREQTVEMSWGGLRKTVVVAPGGIVMMSMRETRFADFMVYCPLQKYNSNSNP
jgi:hypothetical protein